jgi:aryl-alcohol dehydrogenase-like predicted oxidoreductase
MQLLRFAHAPETLRLGDLEVRRLGFGAMRLTGKEVWGEPNDVAAAHAVLRRAIELGVNLIDTAWYYGPFVANRLIVEALHPYPSDLVIATKLGARRLPDKSWVPALRPEELRAGVEEDLSSLRLEQLPLVHLRWIDHKDVTFDESLDAMIDLQRQGKVRHLALSNVTVAQLEHALDKAKIVAVQNLFNLRGQAGPIPAPPAEQLLAACEQRGIAFLPFFPLATGALTAGGGSLDAAAQRHNCTPAQLALAWLLARSPVMLPIPGTSKITHLEENLGSVHVRLDEAAMKELAPNA